MNLPPLVMHVEIAEQGKKPLRLWLPIFLAWLLILAFAILLSPVILVLALLSPFVPQIEKYFRACPVIWEMLCLARETTIDIDGEDKKVFIDFQ